MKTKITLIALALGAMGMAHAAVTAEEAAHLGKDLTPWGAEKAGNKEGTIPPYTGGMPVDMLGAGWDSNKDAFVDGRNVMPDPYKDEKPLYRITHSNLSQYADKLSETTRNLFKNDPNFYMDIFPTHRVVNYPKYYLDSSIANATRCKVEEIGGNYVPKGCKGGMPFPIPKTGAEVMLNLTLGAYFGSSIDQDNTGVYVDRNGGVVLTSQTIALFQFPFQDPRYSLEDYENLNNSYAKLQFRTIGIRRGPARIAGEVTMLIFPTDDRNAISYTYQPGNRRVRTSPNVEYDYPLASAGGAGFYDEVLGFTGHLDRFDWKLVGKKEMILPYSNYRLAWGEMSKALMAGHPNPAYWRWELHRTWVVDATRKPGARHAYAKRRYYIDEDTPASMMGDNWDDKGNNMRGNYMSALWIPDYQVNQSYYFNCDILSGAYASAQQLGNGLGGGIKYRNPMTGVGGMNPGNKKGPMLTDSDFTPEALARRSAR